MQCMDGKSRITKKKQTLSPAEQILNTRKIGWKERKNRDREKKKKTVAWNIKTSSEIRQMDWQGQGLRPHLRSWKEMESREFHLDCGIYSSVKKKRTKRKDTYDSRAALNLCTEETNLDTLRRRHMEKQQRKNVKGWKIGVVNAIKLSMQYKIFQHTKRVGFRTRNTTTTATIPAAARLPTTIPATWALLN